MQNSTQTNEISLTVERFVGRAGPHYRSLLHQAFEIVVFGSRAAGLHRRDSDLDLLLVLPSMVSRHSSPILDCLMMVNDNLCSSTWLGSELASHVAQYGIWIVGEGRWRAEVRISERAILNKQRHIIAIGSNAAARWSRFHPVFQTKYATMFRRELQRLDLLLAGKATPPTAVLDRAWKTGDISHKHLRGLAENLKQESFSLSFADHLLGHNCP